LPLLVRVVHQAIPTPAALKNLALGIIAIETRGKLCGNRTNVPWSSE
jgi:hypothetical protein